MSKSSTSELASFIKNLDSPSFKDEEGLSNRLIALNLQFKETYGQHPEVHVRSPGRAEIIGNHTDYNLGYALSAAISRSTLVYMSRRPDSSIRIRSNSFPGTEVTFSLDKLEKASDNTWANYARGVVMEMLKAGYKLGGANILVDSNIPGAGGVSSSASFEVGLAVAFATLYGADINTLQIALMCRQAENGPMVGTPCGLLDQASVAFGKSGKTVMLDFKPTKSAPVGVKLIPADIASQGLSFVITVDADVKRNLGETGYPARRKMCEESVPVLSKLVGKPMESLRDLSVSEFETHKAALIKACGDVVRTRVEHVVYENQRVLDAAKALENNNFKKFGELLTASGKSAIELYELADKTPELSFLVEHSRTLKEVWGTRNMGGGFSGIILSLMKKSDVKSFEQQMNSAYKAKWGRDLQFIDFNLTQGVEVL